MHVKTISIVALELGSLDYTSASLVISPTNTAWAMNIINFVVM